MIEVRPYITDIQTNIKVGSLTLSDLSANLFITGPNGSGKTAVLNALELALTGEARDLGGRDKVRSAVMLAQLAPEGEGPIYARVKFSSGDTAEWVLEEGKRPKWTPPPFTVRWLYPEIANAVKGSKAVCARFLVKYFSKDGAQLLEAEEKARKAASAHNAEARALKVALTRLGALAPKAAEHEAKAGILHAIVMLTGFQVQHGLSTCGTCGSSDIPSKVLAERQTKAQAQLEAIGGPPETHRAQALQTALEEATRSAEVHKTQAIALLDKMYTFVETNREGLAQAITKYIPASLEGQVGIQLTKGAIFIGIQGEKGHIHTYISGAQFMALCVGIAGAIAVKSPQDELVVLATPDKALDHEYLKYVMGVLQTLPIVTVFQSPIRPRGRPSAHWTEVDMGAT